MNYINDFGLRYYFDPETYSWRVECPSNQKPAKPETSNFTNMCKDFLEKNSSYQKPANPPGIKDVIYNPPATIVFWTDGTKTVVKCGENDIYDPEKGLAMAIAKKAFGNQGNYYEVFKEWLPSEFDWSDLDEYNKVDDQNTYSVLKSALSDLKKKCEDFVEKYYSPKPGEMTHTKDAHSCDTCRWQDNEGGCCIKEFYGCENHKRWTPSEFDY